MFLKVRIYSDLPLGWCLPANIGCFYFLILPFWFGRFAFCFCLLVAFCLFCFCFSAFPLLCLSASLFSCFSASVVFHPNPSGLVLLRFSPVLAAATATPLLLLLL